MPRMVKSCRPGVWCFGGGVSLALGVVQLKGMLELADELCDDAETESRLGYDSPHLSHQ